MRARLSALLLLLIALCASTGVYAQDTDSWFYGKPIKNIVFEGLLNVKSSELDGVVKPYIGRIFSESLFKELMNRLYALEYFDSLSPNAVPVDAEKSALILKFRVEEKPVVSKIRFEGLKGVRQSELLDVVTIKTGDVVNSEKLAIDEQAIRDKYLERGYPDVVVKSEMRAEDARSMGVYFMVVEGEQTAIEDFRFEGNDSVSERTLRGRLSLKPKSLLSAGAFQDSKLMEDKASIESYYRERGYADATVFDIVRDVRKDKDGKNLLTLTFRIREGRQYTFAGIAFEGNVIFPTERLAELVVQKDGEVVNIKRLESDFQRIADLYYENGYIFNSINKKEIRDDENGTIKYVFTIVERGRAYIENIIIKGNQKTKEEVILREIPLEPGEIFSKTKVMDGLRNLYNLQYFSSITPDTPQGSSDNLMNLVFNVEEQPTADIQFGLTFSGSSDPKQFPISAMVKWSDRNFLGSGKVVGVSLTGSPQAQELSFNYTERWMFGSPLSGNFDFTVGHYQKYAPQRSDGMFVGDEDYAYPDPYNSYAEYEDNNKSVADAYLMTYDRWSYSVGFSSGYRFSTPFGRLGIGGGLRSGIYTNYYDDAIYRPFDPTLRYGNGNWLLTNSVSTTVSLDNRDLSYDPSKGTYLSQRFGFVGLLDFEREHYIRSDTKAEAYLTLYDFMLGKTFRMKAVLAGHTGFSMINPQMDGDLTILQSSQLSIDGMFIGRGWYSESANYGRALWENWLEIRIPLAPNILAFDWFLDAAVVKGTPQDFQEGLIIDDFRFSLGGGFRFAIPQFPFRFSLAKRFKYVDGELTWMPGGLFKNKNADSGLDFVLSFVLPTN